MTKSSVFSGFLIFLMAMTCHAGGKLVPCYNCRTEDCPNEPLPRCPKKARTRLPPPPKEPSVPAPDPPLDESKESHKTAPDQAKTTIEAPQERAKPPSETPAPSQGPGEQVRGTPAPQPAAVHTQSLPPALVPIQPTP